MVAAAIDSLHDRVMEAASASLQNPSGVTVGSRSEWHVPAASNVINLDGNNSITVVATGNSLAPPDQGSLKSGNFQVHAPLPAKDMTDRRKRSLYDIWIKRGSEGEPQIETYDIIKDDGTVRNGKDDPLIVTLSGFLEGAIPADQHITSRMVTVYGEDNRQMIVSDKTVRRGSLPPETMSQLELKPGADFYGEDLWFSYDRGPDEKTAFTYQEARNPEEDDPDQDAPAKNGPSLHELDEAQLAKVVARVEEGLDKISKFRPETVTGLGQTGIRAITAPE
jgi:hypothetical protein